MSDYDNNFRDEDDLIQCMERGCEVEFAYKDKVYSITRPENKFVVMEAYNENSEKQFFSARAALRYDLGDKHLKNALADIQIIFRTF